MKKVLTTILIVNSILNCYSQFNHQKSDSIFEAYAQQKLFSGSVLVSNSDSVLYFNSFGYADFENKTKFDTNSIFYLASLAKPITASAILFLEQEGKLRTKDKITNYITLPDYNLTIEDLLSHTSGFRETYTLIETYGDTSKTYSNKSFLKLLEKSKPKLEEKTWYYSDINFILLACIIEKVSEKFYEKFINETFYKNSNLSLRHYFLDSDNIAKNDFVKGFKEKDNNLELSLSQEENRYVSSLKNLYGDGGLFGSVYDLNEWMLSLDKGKIFEDSTISKFYQPFSFETGEYVNTPWGATQTFVFERDLNSNEINGAKGGSFVGYMGMLVKLPEQDLNIIILSNIQTDEFWNISSKFWSCIE